MKKMISIVLVGVLMLGLCACGNEPTLVGTKENAANTTTAAPSADDQVFKVGDIVKLGDVEVTFIGVTESEGSEFFKPADGKIFVLCEFEIANNSDEDVTVSSIMSFCAYCDDYECDLSISAMAEKDDKEQLDGTVAPEKKMKGVVGYEIPVEWKNLEIHYQPDVISDDKIVFIAENN